MTKNQSYDLNEDTRGLVSLSAFRKCMHLLSYFKNFISYYGNNPEKTPKMTKNDLKLLKYD